MNVYLISGENWWGFPDKIACMEKWTMADTSGKVNTSAEVNTWVEVNTWIKVNTWVEENT